MTKHCENCYTSVNFAILVYASWHQYKDSGEVREGYSDQYWCSKCVFKQMNNDIAEDL